MSDIPSTALEFIEATRHVEDGALGLEQVPAFRGAESGDAALEFTFEYQGFLFAVRADASDQKTNMTFRANLGSLPYTAEDPAARSNAIAVLTSATRDLGGRVHLTPRQRVILSDEITVNEPLTPIVLMSRAARLLLRAKPYLELLSAYIRPPIAI